MSKKTFAIFVMVVCGYTSMAWASWPHVGGEQDAKATHLLAKKS